MGFLSFNRKKESSGIFIPSKSGYIELKDSLENTSINGITEHLGYHIDQAHTLYKSGLEHTGIQNVIVEIFSTNVIFVLTDKSVTSLDQKKVDEYLTRISIAREFDSVQTQTILESAVANKSLDLKFLARVLKFENSNPDGIQYVQGLGLYLYFIDGKLVSFQSSDGLNEWAKKLKELNPSFIKGYEQVAQKYWKDNTSKILNEINIQADALAGTPDAVSNPFLPLHEAEFGTINFAMLLVCHYQKPITMQEFKLINHGRYYRVGPNTFMCGKFVYLFDEHGQLQNNYLSE